MDLGPNPLTALTPLAYIAGGVGLWTLVHWFFEFSEKHLDPGTRDDIALHLLEAEPPNQIEGWQKTFPGVFDAVFGERHVSWGCFWKSSLASSVFAFTLTMIYLVREGGPLELHFVAVYLVVLNFIPDYVSLLQTRYLLKAVARNPSALVLLSLLLADVILTGLIFLLWVPPVTELVGFVIETGEPLAQAARDVSLPDRLREYYFDWPDDFLVEALSLSGQNSLGIFLWTTYFTSVWLWLYALSVLIVRTMTRLSRGAAFLRDHLNIEEKPLSSMGFVAGGLTAFVWWGICLVSWLRS